MKVRSGAALPAIVMIVAVMALLTSVLRIWQVDRWNDTLHDSYCPSPADSGSTLRYELPEPEDASDSTFELKHAIQYYDAPDGSVVKTLPAGVYLRPRCESVPLCYGWLSRPTDHKGWRVAAPFATAGNIDSAEYFVKLSDLQQAAVDALGNSAKETLDVTFASIDGKEIARTFTRSEYETLRLDFYDYEHGQGALCPPDLDAPIWTGQTLFGLIAGVVLIGWGAVLFVVRFKGAKKQEEQA